MYRILIILTSLLKKSFLIDWICFRYIDPVLSAPLHNFYDIRSGAPQLSAKGERGVKLREAYYSDYIHAIVKMILFAIKIKA